MSGIVRQPCDEGVMRSGVAAPATPAARPWILAATIVASGMAFIDGTVVNVALPGLQTSLGASAVDAQWIVESYALFLAALILVGGSLGDHFGRRRVFLWGVSAFALSSVWCGLAPNPENLIAARTFQGVGGALMVPGSLAIISASFDGEARGKAIGTWSGFSGVTAALGPVLGGYLVENLSWQAAFLMNVPLAIAVVLISVRYVPESRDPGARRLDLPGAALATLGLGGVVFGLIEASARGLADPLVIASLTIGAAALVAFVLVERSSPEPMMPLGLFRSRDFAGANLLTFFLYAALGGSLYFLPFLLIQVHGYSATAAGAAWLPFVAATFLLSRWAGRVAGSRGARSPLVIGSIVTAAGFVLLAVPGTGSAPYWTAFFPAVATLGLGMSLVIAPLTTTVMNSVGAGRSGLASGVNNAVSRAAGLLALAALGILVFLAFSAALGPRLDALDLPPRARAVLEGEKKNLGAARVPGSLGDETAAAVERAVDEAFVTAFRLVMLVGAGLSLASAIVASTTGGTAGRRAAVELEGGKDGAVGPAVR